MMIKILLAADFHLGIDSGRTPVPHTFRLSTFRRIASLAALHDVFLIAGDLFDGITIDDGILEIVAGEFHRIQKAGAKIVSVPGERELDKSGAAPSFMSNLNISHFFGSMDNPETFTMSKEGQKIFIYGLPGSPEMDVSKVKRVDESGFHIGLFHAEFQPHGDGVYREVYTISRDDIRSLNLDFYGLGHHHNFKLIKSLGKIIGAYTGSPESIFFDEKGDRYVLSLVIKGNEMHQIKRLAVNSIKLRESEINCAGLKNEESIIKELSDNISNNTILKLVLRGNRDFVLNNALVEKFEGDYLKLFIDDHSRPSFNALIGEYKGEDTLKGEFFSKLKERLDKGIPGNIEAEVLSDILNQMAKTGSHTPEEFLCKYRNA